jgi:flavin reductase (DIM6/NTAB) family NADH-FMN oxidoreductase RutF
MIRSTDGSIKDTLNNIRGNGEFVINLVTEELVEAMNITATELPSEINEFEQANLTPAPSQMVKPPRVAESPVNFECKVSQIVNIGDGGKGSASIVIGEVLHMQVSDQIVSPNFYIDTLALNPVGRLAGPNYATIGKILEVPRLPSEIEPK